MSSSLLGGARDPAVPEHPMYRSLDLGYPPFEHFGSARYCDLDTFVQADSTGLVMTPREDVLAQVEGPEQNRAPFLRFLSSLSERQRLGKALPGQLSELARTYWDRTRPVRVALHGSLAFAVPMLPRSQHCILSLRMSSTACPAWKKGCAHQ